MRFIAGLMAAQAATLVLLPNHVQASAFPYQATVVADEVFVRSGGGESFYPTQRLQRDAVVTVRRHDPGGWYVIEPPAGSFSWIPARYVQPKPNGEGVVGEDDIVVFVGSEFGDESNVWQRKLSRGDAVRILDERELDTLSGPRKMYRIAPPKREWRWIPGSAVVPLDADRREQHDQNPFDVPSDLRRHPDPTVARGPAASSPPPPSARLARITAIRSEQRQLAEIDQRFREMIRNPMSEWDLDAIQSRYTQLQKTASYRPIAGQIDLRYPAIERYRERLAKAQEFEQLTSETERRDAELIAAQYGSRKLTTLPNEVPPVSESDNSGVSPTDFDFLWGPEDSGLATNVADPVASLAARSSANYIGAGIVQKSPAGEYILTTPAGRVLARLEQTSNVQLDEFIGRQVGLHGKRWYRDDIRTDYIEVSALEPVRIRR